MDSRDQPPQRRIHTTVVHATTIARQSPRDARRVKTSNVSLAFFICLKYGIFKCQKDGLGRRNREGKEYGTNLESRATLCGLQDPGTVHDTRRMQSARKNLLRGQQMLRGQARSKTSKLRQSVCPQKNQELRRRHEFLPPNPPAAIRALSMLRRPNSNYLHPLRTMRIQAPVSNPGGI